MESVRPRFCSLQLCLAGQPVAVCIYAGKCGTYSHLYVHLASTAGSELARRAIETMLAEDIEDIVLECEVSNVAALNLYDNLGFVRDKRLNRCASIPLSDNLPD